MISDIVIALNDFLVFPKGSKLYGIAQSVIRANLSGSEMVPCMVDKNGEGQYVGIDDTLPVIVYHKTNSIQVSRNNNAIGDSKGDTINTYNNAMIVYLNRRKTGLMPADVLLLIQNGFPEGIKMKPYKNIVIRLLNVILNSNQVWASEYQNTEFQLPPESSMFAINYQIESTFKKGCFDKCS